MPYDAPDVALTENDKQFMLKEFCWTVRMTGQQIDDNNVIPSPVHWTSRTVWLYIGCNVVIILISTNRTAMFFSSHIPKHITLKCIGRGDCRRSAEFEPRAAENVGTHWDEKKNPGDFNRLGPNQRRNKTFERWLDFQSKTKNNSN